MKVERKEEKFIPITITLESQEEVEWVRYLAGNIIGGGGSKIKAFYDELYNGLDTYAEDYYHEHDPFKDQSLKL